MPVSQNKVVTGQALKAKTAIATLAKTVLTDATNAIKLMDAGANGSILYGLLASARATAGPLVCYLFRSPDNGTTLNLVKSVTMPLYTLSTTAAQTPVDFGYSETVPLRLAIGDSLYVAISVAVAGGVSFDGTAEDL
jgi:hypothetical protein